MAMVKLKSGDFFVGKILKNYGAMILTKISPIIFVCFSRVFYGSSLDNVQFVTLQNADNPQKAPVFSQLMSSNSETDFVLISPGK